MENSAYAPNPLPPPALVVFSQAGGLSDALRMQRPYSSIQRDECKEIVTGSGGLCGGFGFRLMESYPLLPQFLPEYPRLVPVGCPSGDMLTLSPSSAPGPAAPPSKDQEDDDDDQSSPTPTSDTSSHEGRPFRLPVASYFSELLLNCKKKTSEVSVCPVCSVSLRSGDLDTHFIQELERLYKLTNGKRDRTPLPPSSVDSTRWQTYQRIRANRQGRLRMKNRKRKQDDVLCPVCNEALSGTIDQLNHHVEICLRKQNGGGSNEEDEPVDVEGDEVFEEYEWAGQRRLRASSLLVGGYAGAGMMSSNSRSGDMDDEGDLVVDGDDSTTFGPNQYSEADVVPSGSHGENFQTLREALISPDSCNQVVVKEEPSASDKKSNASSDEEVKEEGDESSKLPSSQVVEALKARVRQLENDSKKGSKCICLICMDSYRKPLVSICCWHVHCEQCWLHTLGAKKLCPQCNMITSPSDLRRIYL